MFHWQDETWAGSSPWLRRWEHSDAGRPSRKWTCQSSGWRMTSSVVWVMARPCRNPACGATIRTDPFHAGDVLCHHCGTFNKNVVTFCNKCGDPVGLQLKYDMQECQERGMTYAAPLKVKLRLIVFDVNEETGARSVTAASAAQLERGNALLERQLRG